MIALKVMRNTQTKLCLKLTGEWLHSHSFPDVVYLSKVGILLSRSHRVMSTAIINHSPPKIKSISQVGVVRCQLTYPRALLIQTLWNDVLLSLFGAIRTQMRFRQKKLLAIEHQSPWHKPFAGSKSNLAACSEVFERGQPRWKGDLR